MTWLTLTDRAIEQVTDWLECNVRDFEIYNKDIWLQSIEQCANNTLLGDDIVFEIRARQSFDGHPVSVKLLRNCFIEQTE